MKKLMLMLLLIPTISSGMSIEDLTDVVIYCDSDDLAQILMENSHLINLRNNAGNTLLHEAASSCDSVNKIRVLLNAGADPNIQDSYTGNTPLNLVAFSGFFKDIIELLHNGGADPNIPNYCQDTPLHQATNYSDHVTVRLLLGNPKTNLEMKNYKGKSALDVAQEKEQTALDVEQEKSYKKIAAMIKQERIKRHGQAIKQIHKLHDLSFKFD